MGTAYTTERASQAVFAYAMMYSTINRILKEDQLTLEKIALGKVAYDHAISFAKAIPRNLLDSLCQGLTEKNLEAICEPLQAETPGVKAELPDEDMRIAIRNALNVVRNRIIGETSDSN